METSGLPVDARRILVYGVTGSGKSVLAERISRLTGIQWHPVDELTWEPGWVTVPIDEQRRRIEAICERSEWILDTAYAVWFDVPLARVHAIVGLPALVLAAATGTQDVGPADRQASGL